MSATLNENNNRNGEEKLFHDDGSIKNIFYWENGVQQGPAYTYDKQGNLLKKSNLVNGAYHGEQIEYYPSGSTKIRRIWVYDFKSNEYEYNLDGDLICEYKNDGKNVKQINYYKNGNIRFKVEKPTSINPEDKTLCEYTSYWLNGKLMCKSKFRNDYKKSDLIEENYLENGEILKDINSNIKVNENCYKTGERKESVRVETKPGVGDIEVITGYYKNGNTKYIKYRKRVGPLIHGFWNEYYPTECYGNWIFYSKSGEVLNERKFIIDKKRGDSHEYSNIVNTRNEDVFNKVIDELKFNVFLGQRSKNKEYTYYLINISLADEDYEEYDGIDLFEIREEENCVIGNTQLSKDISKIERSLAITSSRNGEFVFSIKDVGRIVEVYNFNDENDSSYTSKNHFIREHDPYYENCFFVNKVIEKKPLNNKPLLLSEIDNFLDTIPEITVKTLKKIQEPDIQNNFLHCFDDISQLTPFLNQNDSQQDINKVKKIEVEGIEFDEIQLKRGVYDYLSYHNNDDKYIEIKNSFFKKIELCHNSYISDEFEITDSSELNVYNKKGELINNFTVFLCPNKSDETVIIFEVTKKDLFKISDWLFTSLERIKNLLISKSHFVNCLNNHINLDQAPPVLLNSSSQDVLGYLANYVPKKEFVLLRRWEGGNDFCDEVYVTCSKSKKYRSDKKLKIFPGSKNMDKYLNQYNYYNPDYFYVYEREVFESLELKNDRLKLEVKKYNEKPKI